MQLEFSYDDMPAEFEAEHPMPADGEDHSERLQAAIDYVNEQVQEEGAEGGTLVMSEGVYNLDKTINMHDNITLQGAGSKVKDPDDPSAGFDEGATVFQASDDFEADLSTIPDKNDKWDQMEHDEYLFDVSGDENVHFDGIAFTGEDTQGAIVGGRADGLTVTDCSFVDFSYSGIRVSRADDMTISDNLFHNVGGATNDNGSYSAAVDVSWSNNASVTHNTFTNDPGKEVSYGIKGHDWKQSEVQYNTIDVDNHWNFSMEFAHGNSQDVEISNNYLTGAVSIPKSDGGPHDDYAGESFHIHNNLFTQGYSIELSRDGLLVEENVFLFEDDNSQNLFSSFDYSSDGIVEFSNNLVYNPGRGVYWSQDRADNLVFENNHIIASGDSKNAQGLFGFNKETDFSTISISDNVIEVTDGERSLLRNDESSGATVENNALTGISDTHRYDNTQTGETQGLEQPLNFTVGAGGTYKVDSEVVLDAIAAGEDPLEALDAYQHSPAEEESSAKTTERKDDEHDSDTDDGDDSPGGIMGFFQSILRIFGLGGGDDDSGSSVASSEGDDVLLSDLITMTGILDETPPDELEDDDDNDGTI